MMMMMMTALEIEEQEQKQEEEEESVGLVSACGWSKGTNRHREEGRQPGLRTCSAVE